MQWRQDGGSASLANKGGAVGVVVRVETRPQRRKNDTEAEAGGVVVETSTSVGE